MVDEHFARVARIGCALPGVEAGSSYGTPALKVRKKLLARMKEDGETLVVPCESIDEKEFLIATEPDLYYQTPHYTGSRYVLVRLPVVTDGRLAEMLAAAWRREAPERLVREFEAKATGR